MKYALIYATCKNETEAKKIAVAIVDSKLAACANIFPKAVSYYRWKGKKVWDTESVLILKTKKRKINKIINKIKKLHSYTTPCILVFEVKSGNKNYLDWLNKSC